MWWLAHHTILSRVEETPDILESQKGLGNAHTSEKLSDISRPILLISKAEKITDTARMLWVFSVQLFLLFILSATGLLWPHSKKEMVVVTTGLKRLLRSHCWLMA